MRDAQVIVVRGLGHSYSGRVALTGVDLEVAPGECVAVLGHNGSGKTTALRCIAGQLAPDAGTVRVDGADPHREPDAVRARAALAFVADAPVFYRDLTVREHVELVALAHGASAGWRQRAAELLETLGLAGRADAFPLDLSSGQQQRAQLACALVRPSRALLFDEPVLRLDPAGQQMLHDRLRRLLDGGAAVLVATHQPAFMVGLAERGLILEDGRITAAGAYRGLLVSDAARRLAVDVGPSRP